MRAWLLAVLLCLLAGCAGVPDVTAPAASAEVDVDTPELRAIKREAGIEACPQLSGATDQLPDLTLPCLGGGPAVNLRHVEGPAVIAVWAQWCAPCRTELPWYQRLHERAGDRLTVLGIDWQDLQVTGALELKAFLGVTFPSVADVDAELADGRRGLPLTYFVDEDGAVTAERGQLDGYAHLVRLTEKHTGASVAAR